MTNRCPCCRNVVERVDDPNTPQFHGFCSERCQRYWPARNMTPRQAQQAANILNDRNHHLETMYEDTITHNACEWVHLVDEESNVVAVARVHPTETYWAYEVVRLAVREDHEGQGLGQAILEKAEQRAKDYGALVLLGTVREDNFGAKVLFFGAGWTHGVRFLSPASGRPVEVWMKTMKEVSNDNNQG